MKTRMTERQRSVARTVVWIFTVCMLIGIAIFRWSALMELLHGLFQIFKPVVIGLAAAYLLNPLMVWLEKKLARITDRKKPHPILRRALALTITMLILLFIIIGLVAAIVPELISSTKNLFMHLPEYLTSIGDWIEARIAGLEDDQPQLYSVLKSAWSNAQTGVSSFASQFEPKLDTIASGGADLLDMLTSGAASVIGGLIDFSLGLIIAIYLMFNKERYQAQARKVLYAIFPTGKTHTFLHIGAHVSYTFMHFLTGKLLDSFIIGLICFTAMTILGMPYVTLISILVGITNIIPFFGPIIGAVPSGLLILLSEPRKIIPFVIFIVLLQQFDGNILGPKILGDSLGLPMFWTLFAITVGGGAFGFIGMVAFIPLFAALYAFLSDFFAEKLRKKGLPADTASYMTDKIHYPAGSEPPADIPADAITIDVEIPEEVPVTEAAPEPGDTGNDAESPDA